MVKKAKVKKKSEPKRRLSKHEKVIAVAKDALRTLAWVTPVQGVYFWAVNVMAPPKKDYFADPKNVRKCEVCAVGALFLGHLRVFDKVDIKAAWADPEMGREEAVFFDRDTAIEDSLHKYFDPFQLDMVESAFECEPMTYGSDADYWEAGSTRDTIYEAVSFGKQFDSPRDRLRAILRNIIKNKGIFRPELGVSKAA